MPLETSSMNRVAIYYYSLLMSMIPSSKQMLDLSHSTRIVPQLQLGDRLRACTYLLSNSSMHSSDASQSTSRRTLHRCGERFNKLTASQQIMCSEHISWCHIILKTSLSGFESLP